MVYTAALNQLNFISVRSARSKGMASQTAGSRTKEQAKGEMTAAISSLGCVVAVVLEAAAVAEDVLVEASLATKAAAAATVPTGRPLGDYLRGWTTR